MAAALVGVLMERTVIRHLYGRPLETLLATWGISLLLIQTVRLIFGAQNVTVANPSWLSGGVEMELLHPCIRCVIPTRDPDTQERHAPLLRRLAAAHDTQFGIHARVTAPGVVHHGETAVVVPPT